MYHYWQLGSGFILCWHSHCCLHHLCLLFFRFLFLHRRTLIALEKNVMFLIYGQNKRETIRIVIKQQLFVIDWQVKTSKISFQRKYSPLTALSPAPLFEHTPAHAVGKPWTTLQIYCALIMRPEHSVSWRASAIIFSSWDHDLPFGHQIQQRQTACIFWLKLSYRGLSNNPYFSVILR